MEKTPLLPELRTAPAVFAVRDKYQIMAPVVSDLLFWVTVDGVDYYDHSNGIIRSNTRMHRVTVPQAALDRAGEYTVCYRRIKDRKPYFAETFEPECATYKFFPVRESGPIKIYHLSDTHGSFTVSSKAGTYFGDDIDLLILNGDIMDHSGDIRNFDLIFKLCEEITGGQHPCVFSRGNHDLRGFCAENIAEYTPNEDGHSYYSFRLGRIWGIVMDCGEDKNDDHAEYGHTVSCRQFRREETEYLDKTVAEKEYLADGIDYRLVIVHNPFTCTIQPPFDIEQPLFKYWNDTLSANVKQQLMISGHLHGTFVSEIGGRIDHKGQTCPTIVGSREVMDGRKKVDFIGCAITLDGLKAKVEFTNGAHEVVDSVELELKK